MTKDRMQIIIKLLFFNETFVDIKFTSLNSLQVKHIDINRLNIPTYPEVHPQSQIDSLHSLVLVKYLQSLGFPHQFDRTLDAAR